MTPGQQSPYESKGDWHVSELSAPAEAPVHRDPPSTESPEPYKRALSMWLQWNAAHEQLTARMFAAGQDQQALQDLLDELDRLRADAVAFSRELID